ncbi:hypothetical protein MTO96_027608 [Rhipicephalus appendiculatus]
MALFRPAWRFALQRLVRNASNRNVREVQAVPAALSRIPARPLSSDSGHLVYVHEQPVLQQIRRQDPRTGAARSRRAQETSPAGGDGVDVSKDRDYERDRFRAQRC